MWENSQKTKKMPEKEFRKRSERSKRSKRQRRRRKREQEKKSNRCYICLQRATREEKEFYLPCNCNFATAHRACIKTWVDQGNARCRVCSLLYDVDRVAGVCFVCHEFIAPEKRIFPCRCKNLALDRSCLQYRADRGLLQCPWCGSRYDQRYYNRFSAVSAIRFMAALLYLCICIFAIAPIDVLELLFGRTLFPPLNFGNDGGCVFIFPGNASSLWQAAEAAYCATVFIGVTFALFLLYVARKRASVARILTRCTKDVMKTLIGALFGIFTMHVSGIIHFRIYCAARVIPAVNCGFRVDFRTFLAGPAGIVLLMGPLWLFLALAALLGHCIRRE